MIRKIKSIFLILLFSSPVLLFQECKHQPEDIPDPQPVNPQDTIPDVPISKSDTCNFDTLYFQNDILPIFMANCVTSGCHDAASAQDGIILDSYDNIINTGKVKAFKGDDNDIMEALLETDPDPKKMMPPPPAARLAPELINAIRIWINQGALNNKCENKCKTDNVTFTTEIWPILSATCRGCHSGGRPSKGISITNYDQVKSLVDDGRLEGTIYHLGGYAPMPPGGQLDSCSMEKLNIWIADGAKNN